MNVISTLLKFIFPERRSEVEVSKLDTASFATLVHPAPMQHLSGNALYLLSYQDPRVRAVITEAKFHANVQAQKLLAHVLGEYLLEYATNEHGLDGAPIVLIPTSLSSERERERGFNQVEVIVRFACEMYALPYELKTNVLKRIRNTKPQTSLGKESRHENMQEAFVANNVDATCTYIIVDDVCTTGATLRSAQIALERAGAIRVHLLALAH